MECSFPKGEVVSKVVRLPFTLPATITNVSLASLASSGNLIKDFFTGFNVGVTCAGVNVAITLVFIKVPFMIETVRPILRGLSNSCRRTTHIVNTGPFAIFHEIVLPRLLPTVLSKTKLTFKHYLKRCKDIIFVTKGGPCCARVAPLVVVSGLRRFSCRDTATVTLIALTMSFLVLFNIGLIRTEGAGHVEKESTW